MPQGYSIVRGGKDTSSQEWISASRFIAAFGSPVRVDFNDIWPCFLLDGSAQEVIATSFRSDPFARWTTFDVDVFWTPTGGAGDVVLQASHNASMTDGGDATAGSTGGTKTTVTAPAAGTVKASTLLSGVSVPAAGAVQGLRVDRFGGDAADTLDAIDIRVFGVLLRKAS